MNSARRAASYILTLHGPERPGLVHAVTGFLVDRQADILELKQFDDAIAQRYVARIAFALPEEQDPGIESLRHDAEQAARAWGLQAVLRRTQERTRVLVMVSKFEHCLNDLLFRTRIGELPIEIVAVVSNHADHRELVEWNGLPFHLVPVTAASKGEAEARLMGLLHDYRVELVVLARYMQVLSENLIARLEGQAINIHHSFLPSFKGARPYHQAWERGVKTVGATAHYVTADLDEGPIISQQVQGVDHSYTPADLIAAGRDTESKALSDAVRWHCEGRVVLHENRTVVLR